jgi:hypothetical protein
MFSNTDGECQWTSTELGHGQALLDGIETDFGHHEVAWNQGFDSLSEDPFSHRLQGDWYNEPEPVSRGVSVVNPGLMSEVYDPGAWEFDVPDKVTRSACVDGQTSEGPWEFDVPEKKQPAVWSAEDVGVQEPAQQEDVLFSDEFIPAKEPITGCSSTSLPFEGDVSPAEVMRCMHNFLQTEVVASISKLRPEKFSIKADVFHKGSGSQLYCMFKARIFRAANTNWNYIIEFRRCQGDAVAFGLTFEKAVNHLKMHFRFANTAVRVPNSLQMPPSPPPLPSSGRSDSNGGNLQPLIDMVMNASDKSIQVEAIATLSTLTDSQNSIAALLGNFEVPISLLSSQVSHAYPAACLISKLAQCGAIAENLALVALQGAVSEKADTLVRLELAETVKAVATQAAAPFPALPNEARELHGALKEALRPTTAITGDVKRRLHEALCALEAGESSFHAFSSCGVLA